MDFTPLLEKVSKKQIIALATMYAVTQQDTLPKIIAVAAVGIAAVIVQGVLDWRRQGANGNGQSGGTS